MEGKGYLALINGVVVVLARSRRMRNEARRDYAHMLCSVCVVVAGYDCTVPYAQRNCLKRSHVRKYTYMFIGYGWMDLSRLLVCCLRCFSLLNDTTERMYSLLFQKLIPSALKFASE
ncbi:hypothetical protein EYC80_004145 [Monilinia laxa]|uniref:Uncharacterized protein n=1 Tax=Monilinia laxa TaxID=61186 RepID=A0A5N6KMA3_MONLA|nr:hypothetical protein EYC80_004145 [Monilinia laxa]